MRFTYIRGLVDLIPVSPNTMYAYLSVIVYGLRGLEIEEKARQILDYFLQLQREFKRLKETSQIGRMSASGGYVRIWM